ncbi:MAG: RNA 2',3'-cyclic phosphodiesterase [Gammaproteobacteria bacterium]|nr:RNA 2',3'-cyclic phosphodiesterase [Gammaproteobacteria bacterium]
MNSKQETYRLFFALWPSTAVRQSIVETFSVVSPKLKGRVMRPQNLHITLHFVGQVTQTTKDCLHSAAQSVKARRFQLNFDSFGHFSKAKIFWMGCSESPAELTELHSKLGAAIENCGYRQEQRSYSPHITLMRKCVKPGPGQMDFSIPWPVDEFVLVESVTHQQGVEYRVINKYSLSI